MNLQRFSCLIALAILGTSLSAWSKQQATAPAGSRRIELVLVKAERGSSDSRAFTRYYLTITNREDFPEDLFEPAPDLPPCGLNKNSSRTWLEIYSNTGSRIYGYCAMKSAAELEEFSFGISEGQPTPKKVYVRLIDRRSNTIYESNLVSTRGVVHK